MATTAAVVGTVATVAGTIGSAVMQSNAAESAAETSYSAALSAADAQLTAAREAIASTEKMFGQSMDYSKQMWDETKSMLTPYITTGTRALNKLSALYGLKPTAEYDPNVSVTSYPEPWIDEVYYAPGDSIPTGTTRLGADEKTWYVSDPQGSMTNEYGSWSTVDEYNAKRKTQAESATTGTGTEGEWTEADETAAKKGAMEDFFTSPQYDWNLSEGTKAVEQAASAKGMALSGQEMKEVNKYASGLASGEFTNYVNTLYQMAGLGKSSASTGASAAGNSAGTVSEASSDAGTNLAAINLYSGNAQASGYINAANATNAGTTNQASIWSSALSSLGGGSNKNTWSTLGDALSKWGGSSNTGNNSSTFGSNFFNSGWYS